MTTREQVPNQRVSPPGLPSFIWTLGLRLKANFPRCRMARRENLCLSDVRRLMRVTTRATAASAVGFGFFVTSGRRNSIKAVALEQPRA